MIPEVAFNFVQTLIRVKERGVALSKGRSDSSYVDALGMSRNRNQTVPLTITCYSDQRGVAYTASIHRSCQHRFAYFPVTTHD